MKFRNSTYKQTMPQLFCHRRMSHRQSVSQTDRRTHTCTDGQTSLLLFFVLDKFKATFRIKIGCTVQKLETILVLEALPDLTNLTGRLSSPNWGFRPQTPTPIPSKSILSCPNWGFAPRPLLKVCSFIQFCLSKGSTNVLFYYRWTNVVVGQMSYFLQQGQMSWWDKCLILLQVGQMSEWDKCQSGTNVRWDKRRWHLCRWDKSRATKQTGVINTISSIET